MNVRDVDVKTSIPLNYGIGHKFTEDDVDYEIVIGSEKANVCRLDITSFTYIGSIGAEHFYGKIKLPYFYKKILKYHRKKQSYEKVGSVYMGQGFKHDLFIDDIELTRPVTKKDKEPNRFGDVKFECYRVGEPTERFNSEKLVLAAAKKKFPLMFEKGWKLTKEESRLVKDEDGEYWENYDVVLIEV